MLRLDNTITQAFTERLIKFVDNQHAVSEAEKYAGLLVACYVQRNFMREQGYSESVLDAVLHIHNQIIDRLNGDQE